MKVLLTGSRGLVGSQAQADLEAQGHTVVGYDLADGHDILNTDQLLEAAEGCEAVIHAAALLGRPDQPDQDIMAANLQGTWNVLSAAKTVNACRLVFLSSMDVLGTFQGQRRPDYLPLDDHHPLYPRSAYAISKHLAERMCELFSANTDVSVVCLRPPGVWASQTYAWIESERAKRPAFEWDPYWEFGAFIDVRDLSSACLAALTCPTDRFACVAVSSSDLSTSGLTAKELAEFVFPGIDWRGGEAYKTQPFRSLIDLESANSLLHWQPQHTWRDYTSHRNSPPSSI